MRWVFIGGGILLTLVLAVGGFTLAQAVRLVRPRRVPFALHPRDLAAPHEEVRFRGPRGELVGWYLPGTNGRTLLALHGVAAHREQWLKPAAELQARGFGVLLFDFRRHGESAGHATTFGDQEVQDVAAALGFLRQRGDVDMARIGVMGLSLGGITAILAAARLSELRAVVAEAAYGDLLVDLGHAFTRYTGAPAFPFAQIIVFWGQLITGARLDRIRPVEVVGQIAPRPIFIIGDLEDGLVQEPQTSAALFARAGEPKQLWQVPGANHVMAYAVAPAEYIDRIATFFHDNL
jgi:dipeptidyl aminopeptidase/acylaminoacyl peptidase